MNLIQYGRRIDKTTTVRQIQKSEQHDMNGTSALPKVVCLCGSTRFMETIRQAAAQDTLEGHIVLRPEVISCVGQELAPDVKKRLDELHLRKIDLAQEVLVINDGGYVGESTSHEIQYAIAHGKRVRWWDEQALTFLPFLSPVARLLMQFLQTGQGSMSDLLNGRFRGCRQSLLREFRQVAPTWVVQLVEPQWDAAEQEAQ